MDQAQLSEQFNRLCSGMIKVMEAKNHDYAGGTGDAFANFQLIETLSKGEISREMGCLVRMTDKLSRVMRLLQNKENKVIDEKIEDTLKDLANYSLLLIIMLSEQRS